MNKRDERNLLSLSGGSILGQQYVYYTTLEQEQDQRLQDLGKNAQTELENLINNLQSGSSQMRDMANYVNKLAQNERKKEVALVQEHFDTTIKYDATTGKNIYHAINEMLSFKDVFERTNIAILKEGMQSRPTFAALHTYIEAVLRDDHAEHNRRGKTATQSLMALRDGWTKNPTFKQMEHELRDWLLEDVIKTGLTAMFHAHSEAFDKGGISTSQEKDFMQAYLNLKEKIDSMQSKSNPVLKGMIEGLGLNSLIDELEKSAFGDLQNLIDEKTISNLLKGVKMVSSTSENAQNNLFGYVSEIFNQLLLDLKLPNVSIQASAAHLGPLNQKADHLVTISSTVNASQLALMLEKETERARSSKISKQKRIINIEATQRALAKINDGFVIFTSDKMYSLNGKEFKKGGFKTGEPIALETLEKILGVAQKKFYSEDIIGAIMQMSSNKTSSKKMGNTTVPLQGIGASAPKMREALQMGIAPFIAYFLFDDFSTIGQDMVKAGVNSIHLMNLNGVYMPLSIILEAMSLALESLSYVDKGGAGDIEDYAKISLVNIQSAIDYQPNSISPWAHQKNFAFNKIKVNMHFFRSFSDILAQLI